MAFLNVFSSTFKVICISIKKGIYTYIDVNYELESLLYRGQSSKRVYFTLKSALYQINIFCRYMGLVGFFVISHRRVVLFSPKINFNLPRTYEKLSCKGEPYRFSGRWEPSVHTNILLLYLIHKDLNSRREKRVTPSRFFYS